MKILSSKVNADGHIEVFVEFEKTVTVRDTAIIPDRQYLVSQGRKDLQNVTDDAYLEDALEQLRARCEDPPAAAPAKVATVASLAGREVTK